MAPAGKDRLFGRLMAGEGSRRGVPGGRAGGFVLGAHAGEACCARPWRGVRRNTVAAEGELRFGRARRKGVLREALAI